MIDWKFIGTLEGQSVLTGYVPQAGRSGVTIATGVDLGQVSVGELVSWGLPEGLTDRLRPYVGLIRAAAANALQKTPLAVTQEESDAIDAGQRKPFVYILMRTFDHASLVDWDEIPDAAQTVITSIGWQYGLSGLTQGCPRFWSFATSLNWPALIAELRNFGDAYSTRRKKEANYLAQALGLPIEDIDA